jgi:hypothetical protein
MCVRPASTQRLKKSFSASFCPLVIMRLKSFRSRAYASAGRSSSEMLGSPPVRITPS